MAAILVASVLSPLLHPHEAAPPTDTDWGTRVDASHKFVQQMSLVQRIAEGEGNRCKRRVENMRGWAGGKDKRLCCASGHKAGHQGDKQGNRSCSPDLGTRQATDGAIRSSTTFNRSGLIIWNAC